MAVHAVILAAGSGNRMLGYNLPKGLIKLNDKPIFLYSLETFDKSPLIDNIILVCHPDYFDEFKKYTKHIKTPLTILKGSKDSRFASGKIAIDFLYPMFEKDYVLIHDAARIFVSLKNIEDLVNDVKRNEASMLCAKSKDTIAISNGNEILDIPNRENMLIEQTPAAFSLKLIHDGYSHIENNNVSDDCQLVKLLGHKLSYVLGDEINFKITFPNDLKIAEILLKNNF